jgi:DNA-binding Lrp family transcriptional regulator
MAGRKPDVTDDEIIKVLRETSEHVLSTKEVAEHLPIKDKATIRRLKNLRNDGRINGKQAGHSWVWWVFEPDN